MAYHYFISVKGAKQGEFKGENGKKPGVIPILGFSSGVTSPRDVATGQASGRRQHRPITIIKEWGEVSVQFFQALVTNEVLSPVDIRAVRTDASGKEQVYMEIHLTDVAVSGIQIDPVVETHDHASLPSDAENERIELTFRKIEIENKVSRTAASDDWEARV